MAEEIFSCTPPDVREIAQDAVKNLLPIKSRGIYEKEYNIFKSWCIENKVSTVSEDVVLAYYEQMSKSKKASTLWASYSMLRACLNVYENTDISKFSRLQALLKRQSSGYQPKKSKILEKPEIDRFLSDADDQSYLGIKVILIMGYAGACRRDELTKMSIDDIEFKEDNIIVSVPVTKTNVPRLFVITAMRWIQFIKKYVNLRPNDVDTKRFFLTYRNGRCITSPIGMNKISQVPRIIASLLKLPEPEKYTGHCFRRSSASQLASHESDLITIKRHGGWKSSAVAEGYIEQSLRNKVQVAKMLSTESPQPSTSSCDINTHNLNATFDNQQKTNEPDNCHQKLNISDKTYTVLTQNLPGISITASDTCNINIEVYNNCNISNNKEG